MTKEIVGIVSEYNPFHRGHEHQIKELRKMGYKKIVCVMSGNSVQRGELSVLDKYSRARAAVDCGADLVLELPYPYSSSGAEFFASAALKILNEVGATAFCFGSESADLTMLRSAAEICESDEFVKEYKELASGEKGTASAYFEAYKRAAKKLGCSDCDSFGASNDLLGVAYLRAIKRYDLALIPIVIKREGAAYNDSDVASAKDSFPSALMIRDAISKGNLECLSKLMPSASLEVLEESITNKNAPVSIKNIESAVLSFFRLCDSESLSSKEIAEGGGGLCERLGKVSHTAKSYDELVEKASGKKYTSSRVRRVILAAMTGATEDDIRSAPSYSTVLAFNENGRAILSKLRKKEGEIAFIVKPADAISLGGRAQRQFKLSSKLDSLYTLAKPSVSESGEYIVSSPYIK